MKITNITLTNFRRFQNISFHLDERLTIFVASRRKGKTTILDAISIGLEDFVSHIGNSPARSETISHHEKPMNVFIDENDNFAPHASIAIETNVPDNTIASRHVHWEKNVHTNSHDKKPMSGLNPLYNYADRYIDAFNDDRPFTLPVFAHYGTRRKVVDLFTQLRDVHEDYSRLNAMSGSLDPNTDFKRVFDYLTYLDHFNLTEMSRRGDFDYQIHQISIINRAVYSMFGNVISNPRIKLPPLKFVVDWTPNRETTTLDIEQLPLSYKIMLATILDLSSRMIRANPNMDDPLSSPGIVLIDEIDLYLSPNWEVTLLPKLMNTFPNVQFVVTARKKQAVTTEYKHKLITLE